MRENKKIYQKYIFLYEYYLIKIYFSESNYLFVTSLLVANFLEKKTGFLVLIQIIFSLHEVKENFRLSLMSEIEENQEFDIKIHFFN